MRTLATQAEDAKVKGLEACEALIRSRRLIVTVCSIARGGLKIPTGGDDAVIKVGGVTSKSRINLRGRWSGSATRI